MTIILYPMFRPEQLGEMLRRYRPEQVSGTTSYWQLLLQDRGRTKPTCLSCRSHAAAAMP